MEIKKVGVVGCGTMGSGIAQVCAQSGYKVVVSETTSDLLSKGLESIDSFLTVGIEKGKVTEESKRVTLSQIKGTTNMKDFYDCDLMIEAVYEDLDLKKRVFTELDQICPKHAILTSNTSTMSIIEIARVTKRQDKVVGLHFFIPVPIMKLLELVKSIAVSHQTLEIAKSFGESIGKTVVIAPDTPGFICNRLTMALYLQAIRMVERGDATPKDIDTALKLGRNWPAGPFEMMDNNLEMFLAGVNFTYQELQDPAYAPPLLLRKMVAAGFIGRKAGKGWYDYK